MILQVIEFKMFDESTMKKGIKARLTISDGTSYVQALFMEKAWNQVHNI